MVQAWVMSEPERVQLMKSRLNKKCIESGDGSGMSDESLYSSYSGTVALTAGGAPNLHGLNRRRHLECRLREEGEVDPRIYGSAATNADGSSHVDDDVHRSSLNKVKRTSLTKLESDESSTSNDNSEKEDDVQMLEETASPPISTSVKYKKEKATVRRQYKKGATRKKRSCQQDKINLEPLHIQRETESSSAYPELEEGEVDPRTYLSATKQNISDDNVPDDNMEIIYINRSVTPKLTDCDTNTSSPSTRRVSERMKVEIIHKQSSECVSVNTAEKYLTGSSDSANRSKHMSVNLEASPCSETTSNYTLEVPWTDGDLSIREKHDSDTQMDSVGEWSIYSCSHHEPKEFASASIQEPKNKSRSSGIESCQQLSEIEPCNSPSSNRMKRKLLFNYQNDNIKQSNSNCLTDHDDYLKSSRFREELHFLVDGVDIFNDTNDNFSLQVNRENWSLLSYPKDPEKYTVMINERPGLPITKYMTREEMVSLKSIVRNMQKMEHKLPYDHAQHDIMGHYLLFINRVTYFLNQFDEFRNLPLSIQNDSIKQNMTVIALVFGSSFMVGDGNYKNTLTIGSKTITTMNFIKKTLTPSVFNVFQEIKGVLGQFQVDVRMGYMIIFIVVFGGKSKEQHEIRMKYKKLLYNYISWKYGEANASYINLHMFKAIKSIRKHASVFESMTATKNISTAVDAFRDENIPCKIEPDDYSSNVSDVLPNYSSSMLNFTAQNLSIPEQQNQRLEPGDMSEKGRGSGPEYQVLREMFYSGASLDKMAEYFHKGAVSQVQDNQRNFVLNSEGYSVPDTINASSGAGQMVNVDMAGKFENCYDYASKANETTQDTINAISKFNSNSSKISQNEQFKSMIGTYNPADLKALYAKGDIATLKSMYSDSSQKHDLQKSALQAQTEKFRTTQGSEFSMSIDETITVEETTNDICASTLGDGFKTMLNDHNSDELRAMFQSGDIASLKAIYDKKVKTDDNYDPFQTLGAIPKVFQQCPKSSELTRPTDISSAVEKYSIAMKTIGEIHSKNKQPISYSSASESPNIDVDQQRNYSHSGKLGKFREMLAHQGSSHDTSSQHPSPVFNDKNAVPLHGNNDVDLSMPENCHRMCFSGYLSMDKESAQSSQTNQHQICPITQSFHSDHSNCKCPILSGKRISGLNYHRSSSTEKIANCSQPENCPKFSDNYPNQGSSQNKLMFEQRNKISDHQMSIVQHSLSSANMGITFSGSMNYSVAHTAASGLDVLSSVSPVSTTSSAYQFLPSSTCSPHTEPRSSEQNSFLTLPVFSGATVDRQGVTSETGLQENSMDKYVEVDESPSDCTSAWNNL